MALETEKKVESAGMFLPVSLNLDRLPILVIGEGDLLADALRLVLLHTPNAIIRACSSLPLADVERLKIDFPTVDFVKHYGGSEDMATSGIVIINVADEDLQNSILKDARATGKIVSVIGNPEASDFDLETPVEQDNQRDAKNGSEIIVVSEKRWKQIATYFLFAFFFMIVGHAVLSFIPFSEIALTIKDAAKVVDSKFYWMIAAGFLAQLVDGALGMGYGVVCTTILLSLGINLPAISGSIHTAEMFSSGISGYSHYKFGNVNKLLFKRLLIPGIIGAVAGALILSKFGNDYASYFRPALAIYTLFLGLKIIAGVLRNSRVNKKVKRIGWLAGVGGFLDSFGGGGWGPLVTSTLISKGKSPRYVIGSVSVTEFFVTLASAVTFFAFLGISHWQVILGLIVGGTIAAPFAARLAGKLPLKAMFLSVGGLVIVWSLRILLKSLGIF